MEYSQYTHKPPTNTSIELANAFGQVFKYYQIKYKNISYNPDSTLYYTLFVYNEGDTIKNIKMFIKKNKHILIDYLEHNHCKTFKSKHNYIKKKQNWIECSLDDIIYALSNKHTDCLHMLCYHKDGFLWIDDVNDYSSGDPCDPHEETINENIKKQNINSFKIYSNKHNKNNKYTHNNEWKYYTDNVIGSADY